MPPLFSAATAFFALDDLQRADLIIFRRASSLFSEHFATLISGDDCKKENME